MKDEEGVNYLINFNYDLMAILTLYFKLALLIRTQLKSKFSDIITNKTVINISEWL